MYYLPSISTVEPCFSSIIWNLKGIMLASMYCLSNIFLLLCLNVPVLYLDHGLPPGWILSHPATWLSPRFFLGHQLGDCLLLSLV